MSGWAGFWQGVIIVALSTYFGLAVVIAIGGFFDVKKMFRRLSEAHGQKPQDVAVADGDPPRAATRGNDPCATGGNEPRP